MPRARVFDFFRPDSEDIVPMIVLIHGGGWISGEKTIFRDEAVWLAQQGYAAACVGYRLAPLSPFPAAVQDIQAFVRFARENHADFSIDPDRIIAFGNSAGGHLAAMSGVCALELDTDKPAERPNGVVSICAISDLRNYEDVHFPLAFSFLEQFMGGPERADPERFAQASPVFHVAEGAPPFVIVHGTDDEVVPVEQSRELYSALCSVGVPAQLHEFAGEGHSYTYEAWLRIRELTLEMLETL